MQNLKNPVVFYVALAGAAVALALCIYTAIPNIYHVTVPAYAEPTKVHEKYVELFGGIAALGVLLAVIARLTPRGK